MRSPFAMCIFVIGAVAMGICPPAYSGENRPRHSYAHETIERHAQVRLVDEKFDPQENEPRLRKVFDAADAKADRSLSNVPQDDLGFIRLFWKVKKKILLKEYGIHWKSPEDFNPTIAYD